MNTTNFSNNTILEQTMGKQLKEEYDNAQDKVTSIFMFGITQYHIIKTYRLAIKKIIKEAQLPESYATELSKAIKVGEKLANQVLIQPNSIDDEIKIDSSTTYSLNQILYGPPGTGKTYHTIDRALQILGIDTQTKDRQELKKLFEEFKQKGQIEFVTFHQSYGYEEFVEGIRPIPEDGNVTYGVQDGIFKKLCEVAEQNYKEANPDKYKDELRLENLIDTFLEKTRQELEKGDAVKLGDSKIEILGINSNNGLIVKKGSLNSQSISTAKGSILYRDYPDFLNGKIEKSQDIKPAENSKRKYHGNAEYYYAFYKELKKIAEHNTSNQSFNLETQLLKPHILIIDEINRGNISKIFGELITLIEPSKRIGADEELRVTLPYSQESFGVPSNLYIIGTMNTADRSITSLDTALRRRFEFIEMMPEPEKLKDKDIEGVNLKELLEAINQRIEFLLDREKTIGHAYLIGVKTIKDLKSVFQNKITPLLQEYFYNDYEAIQAVLNDNGMIETKSNVSNDNGMIKAKEKNQFLNMGKFKHFIDEKGMDEKKVFAIAHKDDELWDNPQTYIAIYDEKTANKIQKNQDKNSTE